MSEVSRYTIPGCRNGEPVTKIITYDTSSPSCETVEFTDGLGLSGRNEGACGSEGSGIALTCVKENDNIYIITKDNNGMPYLIDFDGNVVTGLTPVKCEGIDYEMIGEDYCSLGYSYTRITIIDTSTKSPAGIVWLNDVGSVVPEPTNPVKGVCVPATTSAALVNVGVAGYNIVGSYQLIALQPQGSDVYVSTIGNIANGFLVKDNSIFELYGEENIENTVLFTKSGTVDVYIEYTS